MLFRTSVSGFLFGTVNDSSAGMFLVEGRWAYASFCFYGKETEQ